MKKILFIAITLITFSCVAQRPTNRELYEQSMINSIRPDSSKIYYDLVQINVNRIVTTSEYLK